MYIFNIDNTTIKKCSSKDNVNVPYYRAILVGILLGRKCLGGSEIGGNCPGGNQARQGDLTVAISSGEILCGQLSRWQFPWEGRINKLKI